MGKIKMTTPLVELDGDEMTRIIWAMIKEKLLSPYIELNTEYYDLGLMQRDETDDEITIQSANAIRKYGVGVKCATITANKQRMEEYKLKKMWKSPNATIRGILDGTVLRTPIVISCIKPAVRTWEKPITIARHAFGDVYGATEIRVPGAGTASMSFKPEAGSPENRVIHEFKGAGVLQGQFNTDESIRSFAHVCFKYALETKQDLWFSTKDTISKQYDQTFKLIYHEIYETTYKSDFEKAGIEYFYTLIDDAVARVIRSSGGFLWACKNYDGDVMSDMVSTAFGSLAMMTSVLLSPDGCYEYEAAHGTVTQHYYRHLKGEETSTNPMATIFAWSGALHKRGELDGNDVLCKFAKSLETACLTTLEGGVMTKDLAALCEGITPKIVTTAGIIDAIKLTLDEIIDLSEN
ncbi:MAG: NADP-dependent isocitrate dehydrogenase [Oscillospiraceae bacterium]|nr:NADP-dependent isocitrate dehydrogenase [Oscillospiraceae bacterium]